MHIHLREELIGVLDVSLHQLVQGELLHRGPEVQREVVVVPSAPLTRQRHEVDEDVLKGRPVEGNGPAVDELC